MSSVIRPRNWKHLDDPRLGLMNGLSEMIRDDEIKFPGLLPDLRRGRAIFVSSDYSGQGGQRLFEALSFLLADYELCGAWETMRLLVRSQYLSDGRRISYKTLRDGKRRRALLPFLNAADNIPGLMLTILIDRRIRSLFSETGKLGMDQPLLRDYAHWPGGVLEKALRVAHFVGLFVAGLSSRHQDLWWLTDEDDIVANEQRLREFVNLFGGISSQYLKHEMGHCRIGTTKLDKGKRNWEDLASIPDLVAGALCEVITECHKRDTIPGGEIMHTPPDDLSSKANEIMNWFSDNTQPLKRAVYLIRESTTSGGLILTGLRFHGTRECANMGDYMPGLARVVWLRQNGR
jgi:hypothetical protein